MVIHTYEKHKIINIIPINNHPTIIFNNLISPNFMLEISQDFPRCGFIGQELNLLRNCMLFWENFGHSGSMECSENGEK